MEVTRTRIAAGLAVACLLGGCADPPCENPTTETLGALTAWESAFLDGPGTPPSPAASFLVAEDGLPLAHHEWVPDGWDGSSAVALVIPGSSAYGELYSVLGQGLAQRGVLARVIDVRGHGRSTCSEAGDCGDPPAGGYATRDDGEYYVGRPGDAADPNQIVRDVAAHVADLRAQWPNALILLTGHSSGAGVVSRFIERGGLASVDEVALIAPFNHFEQPQNHDDARLCDGTTGSAYAQVDLGALGDALRGNEHRYVLNFVKEPELTTDLDTLRYSYTVMTGMAASDPDAFWLAYADPVLWIAAEDDALLDLETSREQFERAPGGGAFVVFRNTSHVGLSWSDAVATLLAEWALDAASVASGERDP